MQTVRVRLPAGQFSAAMAAMREWLDRNRYEPAKFTYEQEDEAILVSVEFLEDGEGQTFANRFVADAENATGVIVIGTSVRGLSSYSSDTSPEAPGGSNDALVKRAPRKRDAQHEQIAAEIERASEPDRDAVSS
jgi:hypothetical protein